MSLPQEGSASHWMPYIGTDDVAATVAAARELGATVCKDATELPSGGSLCRAAGSTRRHFRHSWLGDEARTRGVPAQSDFSWHELSTRDLDGGTASSTRSFSAGTQGPKHDMGELGFYQLFARDGRNIGGMFVTPPGMSPHWLSYVRVTDVDEAANAAKAGGGSVINGPMEVPGGDWIAQIVDPQGAAFAVHELKSMAKPARAAKTAKGAKAPKAKAAAASETQIAAASKTRPQVAATKEPMKAATAAKPAKKTVDEAGSRESDEGQEDGECAASRTSTSEGGGKSQSFSQARLGESGRRGQGQGSGRVKRASARAAAPTSLSSQESSPAFSPSDSPRETPPLAKLISAKSAAANRCGAGRQSHAFGRRTRSRCPPKSAAVNCWTQAAKVTPLAAGNEADVRKKRRRRLFANQPDEARHRAGIPYAGRARHYEVMARTSVTQHVGSSEPRLASRLFRVPLRAVARAQRHSAGWRLRGGHVAAVPARGRHVRPGVPEIPAAHGPDRSVYAPDLPGCGESDATAATRDRPATTPPRWGTSWIPCVFGRSTCSAITRERCRDRARHRPAAADPAGRAGGSAGERA